MTEKYVATPLKVESAEGLKILLCTANVGNAEPTSASMNHMIPPNGLCSHVTPLAGKESSLKEGSFDIIIVGMQEATFKSAGVDDSSNGKKRFGRLSKRMSSGMSASASANDSDFDLDTSTNSERPTRMSSRHSRHGFSTIKETTDLSQRHLEVEIQDMNKLNIDYILEDPDEGGGGSVGSSTSRSTRSATRKTLSGKLMQGISKRFLGKDDEAERPLKTHYDGASDAESNISGSSFRSGSCISDSSKQRRGRVGKLGHSMQFAQDEKCVENSSTVIKNLVQETLGTGYKSLVLEQRGQMRLHIWVKAERLHQFQNFTVKFENTGLGHLLPNKGGILCTLTFCRTRITFLTAHLAAHEGEGYYKARVNHIKEILRGAKTFMNYDTAISSHHMFVMGDLNFRVRLPPDVKNPNNKGSAGKGAPETDKEKAKRLHLRNFNRVLKIIRKKDWERLYSYDELQAGIKRGELLHGFDTLPCSFNPTFKMLRGEGFQYKDQRTPSYTDRILFKSAEALDSHLIPLAYEPCPGFITSDHKPIRGAFTLVPNVTLEKAEEHHHRYGKDNFQPLRIIFKDMECSNLPSMDVNGFSDPYLLFVWDDRHVLRDAQRMNDHKIFKKKKKWPKTKYITRTLNPKWDQEIHLIVKERPENDSMLFVTAMDYDMQTADDLMCTCALNIKELVRSEFDLHADHDSQKTMTLDRPMIKYGKEHGRIKCTIEVKAYDMNEVVDTKAIKKKMKSALFASMFS